MPTRFGLSQFRVAEEDWAVLTTVHPSVLLVGPEPLTSEFVDALLPTCTQPVSLWGPIRQDVPASGPSGTLILHDTDRLSLDDQRQLSHWLAVGNLRQVVTTASTPLFPLVEQGRFLASLYYRLNVMYLTFGSPDTADRASETDPR